MANESCNDSEDYVWWEWQDEPDKGFELTDTGGYYFESCDGPIFVFTMVYPNNTIKKEQPNDFSRLRDTDKMSP